MSVRNDFFSDKILGDVTLVYTSGLLMPFLSVAKNESIEIKIYVQPKASKSRIIGLYDGLLKIAVTSPPVDGRANREVVKFLAKCLKIPRSDIVLRAGLHSRRKTFAIAGLKDEEVRRLFAAFL